MSNKVFMGLSQRHLRRTNQHKPTNMAIPNPPSAHGPANLTAVPPSASIEELVDKYKIALDELKTSIKREEVLALLCHRDRITTALASASSSQRNYAEIGLKLMERDNELKTLAPEIVSGVNKDDFALWSETFQADPESWWWFLHDRVSKEHARKEKLTLALAGLLMALTLAFANDIFSRIFKSESDGVFDSALIIQACATFLAGSAFTEAGQHWLKKVLAHFSWSRARQSMATLGLALCLFLLACGVKLTLPALSETPRTQGLAQLPGSASSAMEYYEKAIQVDPRNHVAHYCLAEAAERVLDYDKAIKEYRSTIDIDSNYYRAYSNLARVHIIKSKDYQQALALVWAVFDANDATKEKKDDLEYSALKNRGWAHLGLNMLGDAKDDLERAVAVRDGAEANALLAMVLEKQGQKSKATEYWMKAHSLASNDLIDASLRSLANERVHEHIRGQQSS